MRIMAFALALCGRDGPSCRIVPTNRRKTKTMLSEHHDIIHEFPEHHRMIESLRATDKGFDGLVARHDFLDDEIRDLEERQQPISDTEIEKMKFERAALKDQIFQALRAEANKG
jgi:uncharacterized protein YdcH (DUF465 family)